MHPRIKMKYMKRLVLIPFYFLVVAHSHAQEFRQTLVDLQKQFAALENMHIVMDVDVFEKKESTTPVYAMQVDISKKEQEYLYRYGDNEMLVNDGLILMINHSAKSMVLSRRDQTMEKEMLKGIEFNLDSMLATYSKVEYLGQHELGQHYRIENKNGPVRTIDLFLNLDSKLISRMVYEYDSQQYVVIDFSTFDRNPAFTKEYFSERPYLVATSKGQYAPSKKFEKYIIQVQQ